MPAPINTDSSADECAAFLSEYLTALTDEQKHTAQVITALRKVAYARPGELPRFTVTEALTQLHTQEKQRQKLINAIKYTLEDYQK